MPNAMDERLTRAVAGDGDALAELLIEHGPPIERQLVISRRWRPMLEPEDVMQISYLEAYRHIGRFDPSRHTTFSAWLARIAQNNLRDAIRGLQRQKQMPPEKRLRAPAGTDSRIALLEFIGATSATPSREFGRIEMVGLLDAAIARLPEDYAAVVRAYDLEGKSIADVAALVGRSTGAVHMLRARAYDCLRDLLGSETVFFSGGA